MSEKKQKFETRAATKLLKRVIQYMLHYYKVPFIIVIACILITAIATVVGATFPQTLVDDYIMPMLQNGSNDFSGLASDLIRLACVMAVGVITAFAYNRIMVNVSQGTMLHLRDDLFHNMEALPIKYFDTPPQFYDMEVFNRSVQTGHLLMSLDCWTEVHPSLVTLPVDWNFTIPYGLLYQLRPGADVARFVALVRGDGPA